MSSKQQPSSARSPPVDFTKKCHYQSQHFVKCGHTRLLKNAPCIVHVCNWPHDTQRQCKNMTPKLHIIAVNELCPRCRFKQRTAVGGKKDEDEATKHKLAERRTEGFGGSDLTLRTEELTKTSDSEKRKGKRDETSQTSLSVVSDLAVETLRKNIELLSIKDDAAGRQEHDPDGSASADTRKVKALESSASYPKVPQDMQLDESTIPGMVLVHTARSWVKLERTSSEGSWVEVETEPPKSAQIAAMKKWWKW